MFSTKIYHRVKMHTVLGNYYHAKSVHKESKSKYRKKVILSKHYIPARMKITKKNLVGPGK